MKIVITTDCFLPRWDGIARFLKELIPFLDKHEVVIFSPDFGDIKVPNFIEHVRFPLWKRRFGDIFFALPDKKMMKQHISSCDVVFNQTIGPIGSAGIKLGKKCKKPVVSFVHSVEWQLVSLALKRFKSLMGSLVQSRARRLYNSCSKLLVPSAEVADLLQGIGVKTNKEIIKLGVNVSEFIPPHSKAVAKRKLNLSPRSKIVGFCGRIAREKDIPTLVSAFNQVRQAIPESVLLVVGDGLESEIKSSKYVIRVGKQNDVVPYLQAMDVFVLPSLTETTSLATMEAMSCGVPVVVTPVGNLREYIDDNVNGVFFSRGDIADLSEKLKFLLANDKLRENVGLAARKTISESFAWSDSAKEIITVLEDY